MKEAAFIRQGSFQLRIISIESDRSLSMICYQHGRTKKVEKYLFSVKFSMVGLV
jgi:hypothetical protein